MLVTHLDCCSVGFIRHVMLKSLILGSLEAFYYACVVCAIHAHDGTTSGTNILLATHLDCRSCCIFSRHVTPEDQNYLEQARIPYAC